MDFDLKYGDMSVKEMIDHAQSVALAFDVELHFFRHLKRERACSRNIDGFKVVEAPIIHDDTGYAVVFHELGHLCDQEGQTRQSGITLESTPWDVLQHYNIKLHDERCAWEWAYQFAKIWTPTMEHVRLHCYGSYVKTHQLVTDMVKKMNLLGIDRDRWERSVKQDEDGNKQPETLGEYRDLVKSFFGEDNAAIEFLDKKIKESAKGAEEPVLVSDLQMRMLIYSLVKQEKKKS